VIFSPGEVAIMVGIIFVIIMLQRKG